MTGSLNSNRQRVEAWDLPTRLFHWLLVLLVIDAWCSWKFSAEVGDPMMRWHMWNGYALLTLLLFRLLWGIWGSSTARFSNFVSGPARLIAYLRSQTGANPEHTLGHNPAGGWSVVAMLSILLVQASCGLFTSDDIIVSGPLAWLVSSSTVSELSSIHRIGFYLLLGFVLLHLVALITYRLRGERLIEAMVTGHKPASQVPEAARLERRSNLLALATLGLAAGVVWLLVSIWPYLK